METAGLTQADEWMALLGDDKLTPPPEGWLTVYQIAEKWGTNRETAWSRLSRKVADGVVEAARFRVITNGRPTMAKCFRIIKK
jgi:hypothetical protein